MVGGGGGGGHWLAEEEPGFRDQVLAKMVRRLSEMFKPQQPRELQEVRSLSVRFEEEAFKDANSKVEYMRKLSNDIINVELKRRRARQAASGHQQQIQTGRQMQQANAAQAIQGGNPSVIAMSQAAAMASPVMPSSKMQSLPMTTQNSGLVPLPHQHMAYPSAPNMQIKVKREQTDMMAVLDHILNFSPTGVSPMVPGFQPGQRPMQSVGTQTQNQHPVRQLQSTNVAGYNPTSMENLHGQPVVRPNVNENHLQVQNNSATGTQKRQPTAQSQQQQMMFNQQYRRTNQQQIGTPRNQALEARQKNQQNAGRTDVQLQSPMKVYQQELLMKHVKTESQPMTPPQQQITVGQQSGFLSPSPQTSETMGSAAEVDWREEMLRKIKSLKDDCFSELMELDRIIVVPKLTEEQLHSFPIEKAHQYNHIVKVKKMTRNMLNFLHIPKTKSDMHKGLQDLFPKLQNTIQYLRARLAECKTRNAKMNTRHQSQNRCEHPEIIDLTDDTDPFIGGESRQQKPQGQPTDARTSRMRQTTLARTSPARQQNHSNHLLGLPSPCYSTKSPEPLQSMPTKNTENCFTSLPIAKLGVVQVASPHASVKSTLSSPIDKPCVVQVSSPHAPVMSTFSSPIAKQRIVQVPSPRASVKSTLPSPVAKPGIVPVASPCASVKSPMSEGSDSVVNFLMHGIAASSNGSNQVTPSKPLMSAPPLQVETAVHQADEQVGSGAETLVAKKAISRLANAVLSSSPGALLSSANSIRLAISAMYPVPCHEKMKRVFDHATSPSASSPLSSIDDSCVTFECDALEVESSGECGVKRQKTQHANDVLLDEIKSVNSTLIDTVISIAGEDGTDGMNSCNGGTLIKLSYNGVSLAPSLKKSLSPTSEISLVTPAKLFVPADYPRSSPVLVDDQGDDQLRTMFGEVSDSVDAAFRRTLRELPAARSVEATARAWDACVRRAITEFAHRHGGGTLSSRLSRWESCVGA